MATANKKTPKLHMIYLLMNTGLNNFDAIIPIMIVPIGIKIPNK